MAIKNSDFKEKKTEIKSTKIKTLKNQRIYNVSSSGTAFIDNITTSDIKSRNIRIKVANKHLFPSEKPGVPTSYLLDFTVGNIDFIAEYKIGSKDGKSRSGILKLGDNIYQETLKIKTGTNLRINKLTENKYRIEKL